MGGAPATNPPAPLSQQGRDPPGGLALAAAGADGQTETTGTLAFSWSLRTSRAKFGAAASTQRGLVQTVSCETPL